MDKIEELKKLKALLDSEAITQEEFNLLKQEILSTDASLLHSERKEGDYNVKTKFANKKKGVLNISYKGRWFLIDAKTKLFINGQLHSSHSTKKGFKADIPIDTDSISIKVTIAGLKSTIYDISGLNIESNYELELIYDDAYGKFSDNFNLRETC